MKIYTTAINVSCCKSGCKSRLHVEVGTCDNIDPWPAIIAAAQALKWTRASSDSRDVASWTCHAHEGEP